MKRIGCKLLDLDKGVDSLENKVKGNIDNISRTVLSEVEALYTYQVPRCV